jgi:hypothetical protein
MLIDVVEENEMRYLRALMWCEFACHLAPLRPPPNENVTKNLFDCRTTGNRDRCASSPCASTAQAHHRRVRQLLMHVLVMRDSNGCLCGLIRKKILKPEQLHISYKSGRATHKSQSVYSYICTLQRSMRKLQMAG